MRLILAAVLYCLAPLWSYADLYDNGLRLQLSCTQDSFSTQETVQFNLTITNTSAAFRTILIPGTQNKGYQLIHFSFFKVDGKHYTEVYKESRALQMDTSRPGSSQFKGLSSKESCVIPLFLNDTKNYSYRTEAHHLLPNLAPGQYEVLVWYTPWQDTFSKYVFRPTSGFEEIDPLQEPEKTLIPIEGLVSNYVQVTITEQKCSKTLYRTTNHCPTNCSFCAAIEQKQWNKVAKMLDRQTYYNKGKHKKTDSSWRMPHRNVAYLSDEPDALLSSLPTYTSRYFIFKSIDGYHYFAAVWQIGIVYQGRSRFNYLTRKLHLRWLRAKSEELGYYKLLKLQAC